MLAQAHFDQVAMKANKLQFPLDPKFIRNICILAHVDHGKTSLVDHLIASNKIISNSIAGKFRYMDYKEEEQDHGVTMKSAGIALSYKYNEKDYLINVVDTPGHIDFSFEVSCAVRICDGALVLIDVVEGVCPQTEVVLRQSWKEGIEPCLVINKIDRLIHELMMTPIDAYKHMFHIVDQFSEYDEEKIFFSPIKGNVIFSSGLIGWGFSIYDFINFYSNKIPSDKTTFVKGLWGDFYYNSKNQTAYPDASLKGKPPMFVTFILDNIWAIYKAFIGKDANEASQLRIIQKLGKNVKMEKFNDIYEKFCELMRIWLPLSDTLLKMVINRLPSPYKLSDRRIEYLLSSSTVKYQDLPKSSKKLKNDFSECSHSADSPVISFVSKMVRYEESEACCYQVLHRPKRHGNFFAFSRIFSGTIALGQNLYVLMPKYIPGESVPETIPEALPKDISAHDNVFKFTVTELYMLMGRDLVNVQSVPAGNIFGIGGLDGIIFRSGTISSTLACPSFSPLNFEVHPIMSVVVESEKLCDYDTLISSLKILNVSDPILQCTQSDKGDHLLNVVGEVHLLKCVKDLQKLVGEEVSLTFSKPIVQLRETISSNQPLCTFPLPLFLKPFIEISGVNMVTDNGLFTFDILDQTWNISMQVDYLTDKLISFLESNQAEMAEIETNGAKNCYLISELKETLNSQTHLNLKNRVSDRLLCFSQDLMTNILIFDCEGPFHSWFDKIGGAQPSMMDHSLCRGMQLACKNGPLMSEKITGLCFIITELKSNMESLEDMDQAEYKLIGFARGCFVASMVSSYRLRCSLPIYNCVLKTGAKYLRIIYKLLNKKYAKIISETVLEGTSIFTIISKIPAPEILGMYDELRSQSSGTAQVQFNFSHWENIPTNPLFDESTCDNYDIHQKVWIPFKTIHEYVYNSRKSKGFSIDEKIIQESEKQRTVKRNK